MSHSDLSDQANNDKGEEVEFVEETYYDHSIDNVGVLQGEPVVDQAYLIESFDASTPYASPNTSPSRAK